MVIHGESGAGKSYLADTAPFPAVTFDVEGGVRFTPSRKVLWDPRNEPPKYDGTWDVAVVMVRELEDLERGYQWLNMSNHGFRSARLDSLSELQARIMNAIAGSEQLKQQDWGTVWRKTDKVLRDLRDLTMHPVNPVDVVIFVCGSTERGTEAHATVRPMLSGQAAEKVGYYVDVMTHLAVSVNAQGEIERRALFAQLDGIAAKDRTGRLGVTMTAPSIPAMLDKIYGPDEEEAQ